MSHNTMSAYHSGTDDADDKKGTWYSGVLGQLQNKVPATKWRFTNFGIFKSMEVSDVFEMIGDIDSSIEFPKDWMTNVKGLYRTPVTTYAPNKGGKPTWWGNTARPFSGNGMDDYDDYWENVLARTYGNWENNKHLTRPSITKNNPALTAKGNQGSTYGTDFITDKVYKGAIDDIIMSIRTDASWNREFGIKAYVQIVKALAHQITLNLHPVKPSGNAYMVLIATLAQAMKEAPEDLSANYVKDTIAVPAIQAIAEVLDYDSLVACVESAIENIGVKYVNGAELGVLIDQVAEYLDYYAKSDKDAIRKARDELTTMLLEISYPDGREIETNLGLESAVHLLNNAAFMGEYEAGSVRAKDILALADSLGKIIETEVDGGTITLPEDFDVSQLSDLREV